MNTWNEAEMSVNRELSLRKFAKQLRTKIISNFIRELTLKCR